MRFFLFTVMLLCLALGAIHCGQPVGQGGESVQEQATEGNVSVQDAGDVSEPSSTSAETVGTESSSTDGSLSGAEANPGDGMAVEPASEPLVSETVEEPPVLTEPNVTLDAGADKDPGTPETNLPEEYASWLSQVSCQTAPPTGATLAQSPPAYTGGSCPQLKEGMNTITSQGNARKFIVVLPKNPQPGEVYPVLFMWHWLKSSASKFLTQGEVQAAVDQQRFIGIIPEAKGDLDMIVTKVPWPFLASVPQNRYEEEFVFFDDMLSCVSQQFKVNKECVSSVGVSAGALFTAQLAHARSQYLSSFLSLSGGTDETAGIVAKVSTWKSAAHKLPALILWGGPQDSCVLLNFEKASKALENHLKKDGHFFIECIHNCQHAEPPITPNPGKSKYESLWDFFLRHPFWLKAGESPFQITPWPYANVPWCGIGANSAKIRTGSCPPASCPI